MADLIRVRNDCRLCGSKDITCTVPLASVPIVSPNVGTEADDNGHRITRVVAPLDTYLCGDCGLIQLVHIVDPALIYHDYRYRTSVSLGLPEHFRALSDAVVERLDLRPGSHVLEFGSNDGTLLRCFKEAGCTVTGVDPAERIAGEATRNGIPTRAAFFDEALATAIRTEAAPVRVVLANNVLANIDDLGAVFRGIKAVLADDGAFVFETQYALDVFERTLIDVIYHEHVSCFSVTPIARAIGAYGLALFDAERIGTKGGSIRLWLQHADGKRPRSTRVDDLIALEDRTGLHEAAYHAKFVSRIDRIRSAIHNAVDEVHAQGRTVAGYGTSVGSIALVHQLALETRLDFLIDDTPFKDRLEGPEYDLPVYKGTALMEHRPALTMLLAWRYAGPIIARHQDYIEMGGRFVLPLPEMRLMPD